MAKIIQHLRRASRNLCLIVPARTSTWRKKNENAIIQLARAAQYMSTSTFEQFQRCRSDLTVHKGDRPTGVDMLGELPWQKIALVDSAR